MPLSAIFQLYHDDKF